MGTVEIKAIVACSCLVLFVGGCRSDLLVRPENLEERNAVTLERGDLRMTVVDNRAFGSVHRAGYNGIAELSHRMQDSLVFAPRYAGFNLEHIFGGDSLGDKFEPRRSPMIVFEQEDEALLYQPVTPASKVESLTRFRLEPPHYIDVTFRCIVHSLDHFRHGYAALFWASYIHSPPDKRITFRGAENESESGWITAFSERHGERSTHISATDRPDAFFFAPGFNVTLANHFSGHRYAKPYYFGRFHDMVLIYMFDATEVIRFSQSPDGGGGPNPAWDFQYLIPDVEAGRTYSFRARIVYKPYRGLADVEHEYALWQGSLR
jgi:hypothetical protein